MINKIPEILGCGFFYTTLLVIGVIISTFAIVGFTSNFFTVLKICLLVESFFIIANLVYFVVHLIYRLTQLKND